MAQAPKLKRLSVEDFASLDPTVRTGVEKLITVLNPFLTDVTNGLDKQLTLSDNVQAVLKDVEFTVPDPWAAATLLNSWAPYDATGNTNVTAGYRKHDNGDVELRGQIKSGTASTTLPAFTLPAGYVPKYEKYFGGVQSDRPQKIIVKQNGDVLVAPVNVRESGVDTSQNIAPTTYASLDGIRFPAATAAAPTLASPFPISVNIDSLGALPNGVIAVKCQDITSKSPIAAPLPVIEWDSSTQNEKNTVRLVAARGLVAGRTYRVKLLAFV